jgi:hypothetical protein
MKWWEYGIVVKGALLTPLSITFAEVATHNHFVLDRGGVVFKQTAPVIKLPAGTDEATHLGLLGLLNSSTACFWLQQVCHNKGGPGGGSSKDEKWHDFFAFNSTKVGAFPLAKERPVELAARIDVVAGTRQQYLPASVVQKAVPTRQALDVARAQAERYMSKMIALQEELDWHCYALYDVLDADGSKVVPLLSLEDLPAIKVGERAFEIVLARHVKNGDVETKWFEWLGAEMITDIPAHWPEDYREIVAQRIQCIEQNRDVALIERVECKRRWEQPIWEDLEREALEGWLLDRLESPVYWLALTLQTTRDLATRAALDPDFVQVAALRFGDGVALEPSIRALVEGEGVPCVAPLRYTEGGMVKRRVWEQVWELQRKEDVVDAAVAADSTIATPRPGESDEAAAKRLAAAQKARRELEVGPIPRPPKYVAADFQRPTYLKLRGSLDVPKERFILYPHMGRDGDDAPVVGWAGWNHLQQAEALAGWYADRTSQDGWHGQRVAPLLAAMGELVPWLRQWHNAYDPQFGDRPGEAYALWLEEALHANGLTRAVVDAWAPPRTVRRGRPPRARANG